MPVRQLQGRGVTSHDYNFDSRESSLTVREANGPYTQVAASDAGVGPGVWTLALRLIRALDRGSYVAQDEVAVVPVLQIEILESGEVSAHAYEQVPVQLLP